MLGRHAFAPDNSKLACNILCADWKRDAAITAPGTDASFSSVLTLGLLRMRKQQALLELYSGSPAAYMAAVNPSEEMAGAEGASVILLWSHPRSVSTAVERAFMQREADFQCVHEPFWEPFVWGPERTVVHRRRRRRPAFLLRDTTFSEVARKLQAMAGASPGRRLFVKDMAQFVVLSEEELARSPPPPPGKLFNPTILPEQALRSMTHTFIIRSPAQAVPSLYRRMMGMSQAALGGPGPLQMLPGLVGMREQRALFDYVAELGGGVVPVVMDAEDLLRDPEGMMRAYCAALGVEFRKDMLEWEVTKGESRFVHSRGLLARLFHRFMVRDFYRDVENSTGFGRIKPRCRQKQAEEQAALATLPKELEDVIQENMPHYHYLTQFRIKPVGRVPPLLS